jgi:hypothetical protein
LRDGAPSALPVVEVHPDECEPELDLGEMVQVELRDSTSIFIDRKAWKRSSAESGTNRTLLASSKMAAASARQNRHRCRPLSVLRLNREADHALADAHATRAPFLDGFQRLRPVCDGGEGDTIATQSEHLQQESSRRRSH